MAPASELFHLNWQLNQACNFNCPYCFRSGLDRYRRTEHPFCGQLTPRQVADAFNATGQTWRIHLSGGEPFLYPGFVDLAEALTQDHQLSINTNLSTANCEDFLARISPGRVHRLRASLHWQERRNHPSGLERFAERVVRFQRAGFAIRVECVAYPPLLGDLSEIREGLARFGVTDLRLKTFRGRYGGKLYPAAYAPAERRFLREMGLSGKDGAVLEGGNSYWQRRCLAGCTAFSMDIEGNLWHCDTLRRGYGNLLRGEFRPDREPVACPAPRCNCPYQGLKFATAELGPWGGTFVRTGWVVSHQLWRNVRRRLFGPGVGP